MLKILLLVSLFFSSTIALSEAAKPVVVDVPAASEPAAVDPGPQSEDQIVSSVKEEKPVDMTSMDFLSKMLYFLGLIYSGMWMLGELLTRISVWTENKWDNKAAAWISQATWMIGAFSGRMGWKLPKLVIEWEAEKIATKKAAKAPDQKV